MSGSFLLLRDSGSDMVLLLLFQFMIIKWHYISNNVEHSVPLVSLCQ